MDETRPLLTIAIPTFNRRECLRELLTALGPQMHGKADVELLVSDNASEDDSAAVVEQIQREHGIRIAYHRQPENIGSDANFVFCFEQARGRYLWICGDDDIIVPGENGEPGALDRLLGHLRGGEEFDLIYATSYPFRSDWRRERAGDPLGRRFHVIRSARQFTRVVNIMLTFISGMIVNRDRLLELQRTDPTIESPRSFIGSNLTQLSWTLPLLREHHQSLVLWERPVAGRQGNANGYSLGDVFGTRLVATTARCLPDRPDLTRVLLNMMLRRWLPSIVYDLRRDSGSATRLLEGASALRASYGTNPRFWIFVWPVLRLPLPFARVWLQAGAAISKLLYVILIPSFWRKVIEPRDVDRAARGDGVS